MAACQDADYDVGGCGWIALDSSNSAQCAVRMMDDGRRIKIYFDIEESQLSTVRCSGIYRTRFTTLNIGVGVGVGVFDPRF